MEPSHHHTITPSHPHRKQVSEKKSRVEQLQREVAEVTGESSLPFEEAKAQVERDIEKKLE